MEQPSGGDEDRAIVRVEEEFSLLFTRVRHTMRRRAEEVSPGLTPLAYKVLAAIVRAGTIQGGELAESLLTDKSMVSRATTQLVAAGLVEKAPAPGDRRAVAFTATPLGAERMAASRRAGQAALYDRLQRWDRADVERLGELLAQLNEDARANAEPGDEPHPR